MARARRVLVVGVCAVLAVVPVGCGGGSSSGTGGAGSGSPATPVVTTVTATVDGRKIVGECSSVRSGKPTVVLEVGMGGAWGQLDVIGLHFREVTQVCAYERAGKGRSDPAARRPRPVAEVVTDAHAFLAQAASHGAGPPYFLVGQSFGGELVILYAEAYPDQVAGFVSVNPSPPYQTWLDRVRTVETEAQVQQLELSWAAGDNAEHINTTTDQSMLTDPLPDDLPYAVMYDEVCVGLPPDLQDPAHCAGMLNALERTAKDLASHGNGGVFLPVPGAGHNIQVTRPDVVVSTADTVWAKALTR